MSLLSVKNLGKAYRSYHSEWQRFASWFGIKSKPRQEHWVLRHISFDIQPGEAIGIMGQNGAGKSTLLKMITGTLQPTEGSMHVNGRIAAILELGMGFNPELTGRQNALHSAGLMGHSHAEILQAMPEIEAFAEIGDYFDQPVRTYSSGMQVRVAFAVATAFRPEILIVDEALSVGDAYFQAKCFQRINQFKADGTTLILVTHSADDVVKHCSRAILLKNGKIHLDGPSRTVANIYLDDLFGKKTTNSNQANESEPDNINPEITHTNSEDVFASRPGYNSAEHRWGQGGAAIIDYSIVSNQKEYPSQIESNALTDFYFKVRFDEDFSSITPGILIKTLEGIFLYGTNSFISSRGQASISANAGDIKIFKFKIPTNLNAGNYLLSFGVSSGNVQQDLTPLDRRYDSVLINVSKKTPTWGLVDLCASFSCIESN